MCLGRIVAPAEPALDATESVLGFGEGALARRADLALLLGGMDVGDAPVPPLAGLGVTDLERAEEAAVTGALGRRQAAP